MKGKLKSFTILQDDQDAVALLVRVVTHDNVLRECISLRSVCVRLHFVQELFFFSSRETHCISGQPGFPIPPQLQDHRCADPQQETAPGVQNTTEIMVHGWSDETVASLKGRSTDYLWSHRRLWIRKSSFQMGQDQGEDLQGHWAPVGS